MATKKETAAADAVENAVETVEKAEAATEEKDDGMVTMHRPSAEAKGLALTLHPLRPPGSTTGCTTPSRAGTARRLRRR